MTDRRSTYRLARSSFGDTPVGSFRKPLFGSRLYDDKLNDMGGNNRRKEEEQYLQLGSG